MSSQPRHFVSVEEYLAYEEETGERCEYLHGEVFPLENATFYHGVIAANMVGALKATKKEHGCFVVDSSVRVTVNEDGLWAHPDVTVVCGQPQFFDAARSAVTNPKILFEVESPSSSDRDMGKFIAYRTIASLEEYVIAAQGAPTLNHFVRQPGNTWMIQEVKGLDGVLHLQSLNLDIPLSAIYENVSFQ